MKTYKKTYIEITNACNLSCSFCSKTKRPVEFMSKELFEDILFKIKGNSKFIYFHVMGEPLLHPEISYFLDLCQEHGYKVNLTTNGTLIETVGDSIIHKPALRQVNFSLHSYEGNTSEYSLEDYLDSIFRFITKARRTSKLLICLRLWNIANDGKNTKNGYILQRIQDEFGLNFTIEEKLTHCKGIKIAENVFLNQAEVFDWPDDQLEEIGYKGFCYGLREQVAILVDGTVVPCCLDKDGIINLGNLKERNLEEIISGKRASELYKGFSGRNAVESLCRKCGYRKRFN